MSGLDYVFILNRSKNEFSDRECSNISGGGGVFSHSLKRCDELCRGEFRCTAFNYNDITKNCVLRACRLPVVPPANDEVAGYDGFWRETIQINNSNSNGYATFNGYETLTCESVKVPQPKPPKVLYNIHIIIINDK